MKKLNTQLKQTEIQKAETQKALDTKTQQETDLHKQIDDLNKQLQAKRDAQATLASQQVAYVAPAPVAQLPQPSYQPIATLGGCQTYWSGDYYLDNIIRFESGGRSCATNPGDCFGLLQACPGAPLRSACGGDPGCQIAWFQQYKTGGRTWAQVWQHELTYGWW